MTGVRDGRGGVFDKGEDMPGDVTAAVGLHAEAAGQRLPGRLRAAHVHPVSMKVAPGPYAAGLIGTVTGTGCRLAITRDR